MSIKPLLLTKIEYANISFKGIEHLKWDLTAKTQIAIIWTKFLIIDNIWCRFSVTDEKKDPEVV